MNGYQVITYKDGEFKIRFGKTFNYNEIESIYVSHFPKEEVMIEFRDTNNLIFNEKTINFDKLKEVIDLSENNKLVVIGIYNSGGKKSGTFIYKILDNLKELFVNKKKYSSN